MTAFSTLDDSEEADKFVIEATREKMKPSKRFEFDPFSVEIELTPDTYHKHRDISEFNIANIESYINF